MRCCATFAPLTPRRSYATLGWIVFADRPIWFHGDVLQEVDDGRNAIWMDPVFRFLQAQQTLGVWIQRQDCKNQESKCPIGQRSRWVKAAISPSGHQRKRFGAFIVMNLHAAHIFD
jgi:hypothetical protein